MISVIVPVYAEDSNIRPFLTGTSRTLRHLAIIFALDPRRIEPSLLFATKSADQRAVYSGLAARDMLAGYEVFRRFYEIGTPAGLAETDRYLREGAMGISDHTKTYYEEVAAVAAAIDRSAIERMIGMLVDLRSRGGRLFILGVGVGAGNAGHAVNDFRKICGIEAYAPTDNVSELTARINDNGWPTAFAAWLRGSRIGNEDVRPCFLGRRRQ